MSRGTVRSGTASPQREAALTERCSFVSVIEHTSEQQDRCFRPRSTRDEHPGWVRHEYAWMRAARSVHLPITEEGPPFAGGDWCCAAFPFFGRTNRPQIRLRPARDTSRHRAMGPARAETLANLLPLPLHDRRTNWVTHSPRREARTVGPRRLPSSSSKLASRFDWWARSPEGGGL